MHRRSGLLLFLACVAWGGAGLHGFDPAGLSGAAFAAGGSDAGESAEDAHDNNDEISDKETSRKEDEASGEIAVGDDGESETDNFNVEGESNPGAKESSDKSTGHESGPENTVAGVDGIHVEFSDGHIERIRDGLFESLTVGGDVSEERQATADDMAHLRGVAKDQAASGIRNVAVIDGRRDAIVVQDFRGWRETVADGFYELTDPRGRTVVRRPLTGADIDRIRAALHLD